METRELFWNIGPTAYTVFYVIAWSAIALFVVGVLRHVVTYFRGRRNPHPVRPFRGLARMVGDLFTQRTVKRRDMSAGRAHAALFYGFVLLFIGTSIITVEYDITEPLWGVTFWHGPFYLIFSLVMDIAGLGLIGGILFMMWRRVRLRPAKLDYVRRYRGEDAPRAAAKAWTREDWVFMSALLVIALTGFVQEGVRIHLDRPAWEVWSPVGYALAALFEWLGMSAETASGLRAANWWFHGVLALLFIAAIPWNKAKHMIAVMGSLAVRDPLALRRLPRIPEGAADVGVAAVNQFSWKAMLHFDACIRCGRCHEACPARASGYPLSPRDLILDLRDHNGRARGRAIEGVALVGDVIDAETVWSCRMCGACQEICPVGIEHPSLIVEMRRHLVDRGEMDPLLRGTLDTIANYGNSFGESPRRRAAWVEALEFPIKDIRTEKADYLWFVGDYAAFDPRNQKVSQTVARLLTLARLDYGLLLESEKTAGNDVRRVGEEGLYESLVEHNLATMAKSAGFDTIVTTDPHSYNTIRNEYPEFGTVAPIVHYSKLLAELLESGRLRVVKPLGKRVTLHDPCHLGRLNGHYDDPRRVLERIGCELVEMPRSRDNSFCCGAGGGRIWIPDRPGAEKPSESRMHEAAALGGIDVFVTCCPKDMTMFEDARKTSGHEKDFVVADLAELVAEAVDLKNIDLKAVPSLVERITDVAARKVADVIATRLGDTLADELSARIADAVAERLAKGGLALQAGGTPAVPLPSPSPAPAAGKPWRPRPVTAAALAPYDIPAKAGPRVLVPVKQVAKLGDEFGFLDDGRDVREEFFDTQLNEWDDTALEAALRLIEKLGQGEVVAVTVGSERAEESLRRVLAKGAHRGVRVWHENLAGADPITIARALAGIVTLEGADLVVAGAQSADHAHGATGTALARILGWPHAAVVIEADWNGADTLTLTRELEGGLGHRFELPAPAVITIQTGANEPRYATMRMIKEAKSKPLAVVDGAPACDEPGGFVVRRMAVPEVSGRAQMLEGDIQTVAAAIAAIIREKRGI